MKRERLLNEKLRLIIVGLLIMNGITIGLLLVKENEEKAEVVATIGEETISRQDWLNEMEKRYGKEILTKLIDEKVVEIVGQKHKVEISDPAIERELLILKEMYSSSLDYQEVDADAWEQQIKNSLTLQELLTRDVEVSQEEMLDYYERNKEQFNFPDYYHISQIIVKTKKEAEQVLKELNQGSSFSALAMEHSVEKFTASNGGDAGYISEESNQYTSAFFNQLKMLKVGEWSEPIPYKDGYAIVFFHEYVEGKTYAFDEIQDQVRRLIALEQMDSPISARPLWNETNVDWFYEE